VHYLDNKVSDIIDARCNHEESKKDYSKKHNFPLKIHTFLVNFWSVILVTNMYKIKKAGCLNMSM